MKVSGYILKFGEEIQPGIVIGKDCKIDTSNFHFKPFGTLESDCKISKDDIGVYFEGESSLFEIGVGGIVKERQGNLIMNFDIKEVSIIPKFTSKIK